MAKHFWGLLLVAPGLAAAQDGQQLLVTATKTALPAVQVPAALSVLYGEDLEAQRVDEVAKLATLVPGMSFQPWGQSGTNLAVVRGVTGSGSGFNSSVLLSEDGVPLLAGQGFDNHFLDVERVEILRGPQSSLYGRNAEVGVINVVTRAPDNLPRGDLSGTYGSRGHQQLRGSVSGPLVEDTLYAAVAGEYNRQNGFIANDARGGKADDRERNNARIVVRWTPTEADDLRLRYSQQRYHDGGALWGAASSRERRVSSGTDSWNHSLASVASLDYRHQLANGWTFRSISARSDIRDRIQQDSDFLPTDSLSMQRDNLFTTLSQEFRLQGDGDRHHWLAGIYLDRDDNHYRFVQKLPLMRSDLTNRLRGNSQALFGEWTQMLSGPWSLTLGGRVERSAIEIEPTGGAKRSTQWHNVSPKIALQYQWQADLQTYASYSQGYRAGGYNLFSPASDYYGYNPEKVRSWELGIKGVSDDRRLRYSSAVYLMDIDDMQVQQVLQAGVVYINNAAKARSTGVELEADYALLPELRLQGSLGLNHTRFDQYQDGSQNYAGNRNTFAPDATANLGLRYEHPGGAYGQLQWHGVSRSFLDASNTYRQPGYGVLDMTLGYQWRDLDVSLYADNLTNKEYDAVGYLNGSVRIYSSPREYGLKVSYKL